MCCLRACGRIVGCRGSAAPGSTWIPWRRACHVPNQEMAQGHYDAVYTRLVYLARWASHADYGQLQQIHDLMRQLAVAYVEMGKP